MDSWLVRTPQNLILGPYSKTQVVDLIQEGALGPQDEVCQANQFWFYLHEREEVLRQLGVEPPAEVTGDDDITLTQTETLTDVAENRAQAQAGSGMSRRAPRQPIHVPKQERVFVVGQIEKFSIWKGVTWVLMIVIAALVVLVLRLLSSYE